MKKPFDVRAGHFEVTPGLELKWASICAVPPQAFQWVHVSVGGADNSVRIGHPSDYSTIGPDGEMKVSPSRVTARCNPVQDAVPVLALERSAASYRVWLHKCENWSKMALSDPRHPHGYPQKAI